MTLRNLKLTIEYEGTHYHGWQTQKGGLKTIQKTIEDTLKKILNKKIKLVASGRTDAGVHALGQVANFKTTSLISPLKLRYALNSLLPEDIVIKKVEEMNLSFHSRFSAKSKLYRYLILNRKYPSAFLKNKVYFYPYHLNLSIMKKQAKFLVGRHNFTSFQATDKKKRNPVREIKKIRIFKKDNLITIEIEANSFVYGMVRNIVGTLIEIARGKPLDIRKMLKAKDRRLSGPTAPACGLYLVKVKY
ncbi:MAG: tRNA pseudouridine(38-40) synthase TruA [Candidatus Omnitrophica bacterium]|nr:tRNA pseudouridine(38-40) synthase TruA [Candidatus Omnitrophota bacterium]